MRAVTSGVEVRVEGLCREFITGSGRGVRRGGGFVVRRGGVAPPLQPWAVDG
jgi:hypothetical protein